MNAATELLEQARMQLRLRRDGAPAKGQPSWVRVFGRCEQRGVASRGVVEFGFSGLGVAIMTETAIV